MRIRIFLSISILLFCMGPCSYVVFAKDHLYEEIQKQAKQYRIAPQNAVIDKIWKATPGYNGKEVDIEASYQNMKKVGEFDEKQLVYREVSPYTHLADLSPSPIYRGHPHKKMVGLTINVAWGNEYLPRILETLQKHGVKATFFLEGRWVKENLRFAKMIVDAKQEVGNHSYTHPDMKTLSAGAIHEQLQKTNQIIEAVTNQKVRWFAPPSGSFREEVVQSAANLRMGTIMWTVDTIDWKRPEPQVLLQRVMSKVHPGAIVLMHPTSSTAHALDTMISQLKEQGYKVGNITELLDEKRID
ncbi:polysaccharide deacetylase family protein [Bacillus sp. DX1.1]|uniref:polysaccharide deacetylase family protein n=1 Tax=unclassified Bacillus (in: firmicutes) TaxID=185979 RepID=UPI002570C3B8|nr:MULTISPECIES: polysaccharide deacetylase family protein [unclassified Bacillus (in: firmicutes)]MDM5155993.1 polysaccharide deacetylase family protein [Bacillus sp. DX1.1]WJE80283.1 polysaccharide deacetylase family protein [Bacillus sp. DX3.1]